MFASIPPLVMALSRRGQKFGLVFRVRLSHKIALGKSQPLVADPHAGDW